jgi:tetratricopeptide (TPR) repeat protein
MSLFRRGPARRDVEAALASARSVVEILSLSRANLSEAQALLLEAEALLEKGDTLHAKECAERGERIATALEGDYKAAAESRERLKAQMEHMRAQGLVLAEEEAALEAIHARATGNRELEGRTVPDYAGARAAAEMAARRAEEKLALAGRVGDAIFAAEMALEGLLEVFPEGAEPLDMARQVLEKARAEQAGGNHDLAAKDAAVAEKVALDAMEQRHRALETLESVERLVAGLRAVGVTTHVVSRSLEIGRALLAKGKTAKAEDVFNEAAQEAVALGTQYRGLLDRLSDAARAIQDMRQEGLPAGDAEAAFGRAKAALKAGNYALAGACVQDVHVAVTQQRELREGLKTWIEEAKKQVARLHELGLALVNDVEEMVGKAEREFANGDYAATGEDLRIAGLLMKPALNGKAREGLEITR